jgi:thioesterase domain-containing protein/acyl carrier protein
VEAAGLADRVTLRQGDLTDLAQLESESADLVILDSITQYLPSIEHLVGLLEQVPRLLAPGATIFVGGVRNLELRGEEPASAEHELLIAPGFFSALPQHLYQIRGVEVLVRPSPDDSEPGALRYDVLLHREPTDAELEGGPARPWQAYANQPRLKAAGDRLVPALREHLRDRLPEYMVPAAFVVLDDLPLSPNGKIDRRALPAPSGAGSLSGIPVATPRTPLEQSLAKIWREVLGVEVVNLDDDFFDLGGHSLLAVKLFTEIERTFGHKLPLSTLFQSSRLGRLAQVLAQVSPERTRTSLAVMRPQGSKPPLFVVHGVYGDVLEYRELVSHLDPDQPVYGIEAPPGEGETVLRTIEQLASDYVKDLRRQQPAGPYFLCGYCWAGALTFEMARQLRQAGEEVALLALIDAACPGSRPTPIADLVGRRGRSIWTRLTRNLRRLPRLRAKAAPRFLWERAVNLGTELIGTLAYGWSVRLRRPLLPAFRGRRQALLYAARFYRPPVYPGRVTLLRARNGSQVSTPAALWGWDRVAARGVELHEVPGEHLELLKAPRVAEVAATLQRCLARARAGSGAS